MQPARVPGRCQCCRPSPISRDRPHCSYYPGGDHRLDGDHHRSLGIGLIAAVSPRLCEGITAAITDLSGSASLQLMAARVQGPPRTPSPISRDRPHCSYYPGGDHRLDGDHHRSLGIGLIAAVSPRLCEGITAAITDLSGSASLQLMAARVQGPPRTPSPISRDRPHCSEPVRVSLDVGDDHHRSLGIGLIAARRPRWWSTPSMVVHRFADHHRSLGIGLIAATSGGHRGVLGCRPSPISRDRPHCSGKKGAPTSPPALSITDLSGSASLQPDRYRSSGRFGGPSPISRDRPHCSTSARARLSGASSHHRSLGIGLIAATRSPTG